MLFNLSDNTDVGHTWLEKILAEFKQEEWVKEMYPELTTNLKVSELEAKAGNLRKEIRLLISLMGIRIPSQW